MTKRKTTNEELAQEQSRYEITEESRTVFMLDGIEYRSREEASKSLLDREVADLLDNGPDSLNMYDLSINEVAEWIANHLDDLVALRDRLR